LNEQLDKSIDAFSQIPGAPDQLAENLVEQGFFSFDDLSVIEPDQLSELSGLTIDECAPLIEFAEKEAERLERETARQKAEDAARGPAARQEAAKAAAAEAEAAAAVTEVGEEGAVETVTVETSAVETGVVDSDAAAEEPEEAAEAQVEAEADVAEASGADEEPPAPELNGQESGSS
jgi:N utilization substance protein A